MNLATGVDNIYPDHFTYLKLPLFDLPDQDIISYFPKTFEFIDEGRKEGCVFIHCNAGVSRAASFIIGYMMRTEKKDYQTVYDHVRSIRSAIRPNYGFRLQLQKYQP